MVINRRFGETRQDKILRSLKTSCDYSKRHSPPVNFHVAKAAQFIK